MSSTPSKDTQNMQFLYAVLTVNGTPNVDWTPICTALSLSKDAATKRWSRLKQAMEKEDNVGKDSQEMLWLMVKHSERSTGFDWTAMAEKCGSTKGAVSKRYSRLKLAFERGDAMPGTPTPTPTKGKGRNLAVATPTKNKGEGEGTPKRKRTPSKTPRYAQSEEEEVVDKPPKRAKAKSTPTAKPRPLNAFRAREHQSVKSEPTESDEDGDVFTDAREYVDDEGEVDEICKSI